METLTISQLIEGLNLKLTELNYTRRSIKNYNRVWTQFLKYAQEKMEVPVFSEELGVMFLQDIYDFSLPREGSLKQYHQQVARSIRMLGDFQMHRVITRIYCKKGFSLPSEFENEIQEFKDYCTKKWSATSVYRHVRKLYPFFIFLHEKCISHSSEITKAEIDGYLKTMIGFCRTTVKNHIFTLRTFFRYLQEEKGNTKDLCSLLPSMPYVSRSKIPTVWKREDIEKLLSSIDRGNPNGKRDYAALLLITKLGLRNSDISNLTFDNLNWDKKQISFTQSKTSSTITLPLLDDVGWAIIDYLKYGRPISKNPQIFIRHQAPFDKIHDYNNILVKHIRNANIKVDRDKPHGVHTLRHTLASRLLEDHTPLVVISEILGHTNINSTNDYLKIDIASLRTCAIDPVEVMT